MKVEFYTPNHAERAGNFLSHANTLLRSYPSISDWAVFYEAEHEAKTILAVPLVTPTPPRVLEKIAKKIYRLDVMTAFETIVGIVATSNSFENLQTLLLQLDKLSYKDQVSSFFEDQVIYPNTKPGLRYELGLAYIFDDEGK